MRKDRLFAPFLMLLAGAAASITMYFFHYSTKEMLPILLSVLIVFYLAGSLVQMRVNSFIKQINEERAKEEEAARQAALEEEAAIKEAEKNAGNEDEGNESI